MHYSTLGLLSLWLLSCVSSSAPVSAVAKTPFGEAYPGTCSIYTLNFDELGESGGNAQDLPKDGYNYKKMIFREGEWGWVSKGLQQTTATNADHSDWVYLQVTTHSGNNAIADLNDEDSNQLTRFESGDVPGGKACHGYHFDLKSFWIRSAAGTGAFQYRLRCRNHLKKNVQTVFNIPAMPYGKFYKITPPATFSKLYYCEAGIAGTQAILDDIKVRMCDLNTCK